MAPAIILAVCFFCYFNHRYINKNFKLTFWETIIILYTILLVGYFGSKAIMVMENFFISDYTFDQFDFIANFLHGEGHRWYGNLFLVSLILIIASTVYNKDKLFAALDTFTLSASLGISIGKWGCFFSGHYGCFGIPTKLPWGVTFPYGPAHTSSPVHPIQIYDSIFHLGLFIALLLIYKRTGYFSHRSGMLAGIFLISTSIYNILMEIISTNRPVLWLVDFEQIIYFFILIMGIGILLYRSKPVLNII